MKYNMILPIFITWFLMVNISCQQKEKINCLNISVHTGEAKNGYWNIFYNKFYKKYGVMRIDTTSYNYTTSYLVKDHDGKYGVYVDGWWDCEHFYSCGDKSKSWFDNPCDAKEFLLTFVRKSQDDNWVKP